MKSNSSIGTVAAFLLIIACPSVFAQANWVHFDNTGQTLVYSNDNLGNHIPDFSYAGYKGGGVALPNAPVKATLNPSGGDDTAAIQNALQTVAGLSSDATGIRGAVLLNPGSYTVNGLLSNTYSGVILRGSGSSDSGTILNFGGNSRPCIQMRGTGSTSQQGSTYTITDSYVPMGATTFHVSDASTFSVGDLINVQRPTTEPWVIAIGMSNDWTAGTGVTFERAITAINGNQLTIDIPLFSPIESVWCTGQVYRVVENGRISNSGIEDMQIHANFSDEAANGTAGAGIWLDNLENCWVQNVVFNNLYGGVTTFGGVKFLTVQDCGWVTNYIGASGGAGAFGGSGQMMLFQRINSTNYSAGRMHFFVTQSATPGPNVFLNFNYVGTNADAGPHQRWAVGVLMDDDTIVTTPPIDDGIGLVNRGGDGSGQGWGAGYSVIYNANAQGCVNECPAVTNHYNWAIGGGPLTTWNDYHGFPEGVFDTTNKWVNPHSLYLEQLKERLGGAAIENIRYTMFTISTSPSSRTVALGGSVNYTVTLGDPTLMSNVMALSVIGLPANASTSFNTNSIIGAGSATLMVVASNSVVPGNYTLNVIGTSAGLSHASQVSLIVGNPSFSMTASPATQTVTAGLSTNFTVSVVTNSSFTGSVNFSVSGLPANTSANFLPLSVGNSASSTLTVTTTVNTPPGTYTLIISGTGTNTTDTSIVTLVILATPLTYTWTGGGAPNGNWSVRANWDGTAPSANDLLFFDGNIQAVTTNDFTAGTLFGAITFNSGAGAFTLNGNSIGIATGITNNSGGTQIISNNIILDGNVNVDTGSGGTIMLASLISGTGFGLTNTGSGTLILATNITFAGSGSAFSGGVTVNGGTLAISQPPKDGQTCLGSGPLTVNSGGTVTNNGDGFGFTAGVSPATIFINGGTINTVKGTFPNICFVNGGTITFFGSALGTLFGNGTVCGITNLASSTTAVMNVDPSATSGWNNTKPLTFSVARGTVTGGPFPSVDMLFSATLRHSGIVSKTGAGTLEFAGANTWTGNLTDNAGIIIVAAAETPGTSGPLGKSSIVTMSGGTLQYSPVNAFDYSPRFDTVTNQQYKIDVAGQNVTFASPLVSNGGTLTLADSVGGGTLILTATNTYTGNSTVNGGTLIVNGSLANGAVTVTSGGTLSGNGVLNGSVTVGGTLSPGISGIGVLTISNTVTLQGTTFMELNKATHTNDVVRGATSIAYGGTLSLTNLNGTLTATDSFRLFSAASYSGAFVNIVPATPASGLAWNTDTLTSDGTLRIASQASPRFTSLIVSGGNLTITGTNGSPGGSWTLLQSTNVALPLNQWQTSGIVQFDGNGNLSTNIANVATNNQTFYILKQ